MVTHCAIYRDGRCIKDGLALADLADSGGGDFVWVNVEYEGAGDATALSEAIDLPELAIAEMQRTHPRARIYDLDGDYFIIVRTAKYVDEREAIDFGEIQILIGQDYAITVRHGGFGDTESVRTLLGEKSALVDTGPASVVWAVVEHVISGYEPIIEALDRDIDDVEEKVFENAGAEITRRMHALRGTIADFYRAVHPLQGPVEVIESGVYENLEDSKPYFKEQRDRLRLLEEELIAQRDQLSSAFDANMALISKEQNDIVRAISSWAAIIAVPTLISGVYGMNFAKMPGLESSYGFLATMVSFVVIGAVLFGIFKRTKWL